MAYFVQYRLQGRDTWAVVSQLEIMADYDLRNASLVEFVEFLFDRPAPPLGLDPERPRWHANEDDVKYDPVRNAELYIELFSEPEFLLDSFSREQLEQGFWAIQGPNLPGAASEIIWSYEVPISLRQRVVGSMFILYEKFFARDSLNTSCNMFFDCLVSGHEVGGEWSDNTNDERAIQQAVFETLCRILQLDSEDCQGAALHGLNHLHHQDTRTAITAFMHAHPELTEDEIDYCMECIDGEGM